MYQCYLCKKICRLGCYTRMPLRMWSVAAAYHYIVHHPKSLTARDFKGELNTSTRGADKLASLRARGGRPK